MTSYLKPTAAIPNFPCRTPQPSPALACLRAGPFLPTSSPVSPPSHPFPIHFPSSLVCVCLSTSFTSSQRLFTPPRPSSPNVHRLALPPSSFCSSLSLVPHHTSYLHIQDVEAIKRNEQFHVGGEQSPERVLRSARWHRPRGHHRRHLPIPGQRCSGQTWQLRGKDSWRRRYHPAARRPATLLIDYTIGGRPCNPGLLHHRLQESDIGE